VARRIGIKGKNASILNQPSVPKKYSDGKNKVIPLINSAL